MDNQKLINKGNDIGQKVNEQKIKYLIISGREHVKNFLVVEDLTVERISNFIYLAVYFNQQVNGHKNINRRIMAGNKCYFTFVPLIKS